MPFNYRPALLILLTLLLSSCGNFLQPNIESNFESILSGQYKLDNDHTAILFKVDHLGFSKFVGRFDRAEASLNYNPEKPERSKLEAVVDMTSINVGNESFEKTLQNRFWLNTNVFPKAHFITSNAIKINETQLDFEGKLTFLGLTQPLNLRVTVNGAGNNVANGKYTLGFSAESTVKRSAYGLSLFTPAIGDEVDLEIHAEFLRQ